MGICFISYHPLSSTPFPIPRQSFSKSNRLFCSAWASAVAGMIWVRWPGGRIPAKPSKPSKPPSAPAP